MVGNHESKVDEYRRTSANTASPVQLIVMLYDGALKFVEAGRKAMERHDFERQNTEITRAQKIVSELMACLDLKQGGEIAANLFGIYNFALNQLIEANVHDRPGPLENVKRLLSELRDAWVTIAASAPNEARTAPANPDGSRVRLEG